MMASKSCASDRMADWSPSVGANQAGRQDAIDQIHGSWEDSFQMLYSFKYELEKNCPGSIVEIDSNSVGNKVFFSKIFVAIIPCLDGFIHGCRPYLGIGSTHLTGKYQGQLAAACGIDGHGWLYPVAYGIFDMEAINNWEWFMTQLRRAIGTPPGLAISSNADEGLTAAITSVFPNSEHRVCMRHLMTDLQEKFHVFTNDMWLASKAYTVQSCQYHLSMVKEVKPYAIEYLEKNYKQLWCRSQFSELAKCDYITNVVSEKFKNWIKDFQGLHVVDLVDQIRQLIMMTFDKRRAMGDKFQGEILPNIIKQLHATSRDSINEICRASDSSAEISGEDSEGKFWRHVVELDRHECSCGEWQFSGKPCLHAIAFIFSLKRARMEDYVHEYYSLARFRLAYAGFIRPIPHKSQWIKVDPGFKICPPKMSKPRGRPRKEVIPRCIELTTRRQQCKKCKQFGHQQRTCKSHLSEVSIPRTDIR